jgi:UPF0755 protein
VSWRLSGVCLRDGSAIAALTLLCIIAIAVFCQSHFHEERFIYVVVERGLSYSQIAERFTASGLIRDETLFLVLGRVFGIEHRARAGRYRFRPTSNMIDILNTTYRERVLIRPGKTLEGISQILFSKASVDSVGFLALAHDSAFVADLGIPSATAEGYLFPETYDVEWQESAESIVRRMVSRFFKSFDESLRARARQIGMTVNEAVTLASIIEKEAMLDRERPLISAVFHNRLKVGMKLQADPTVRYALKKWSGRVLYRDLKVDSPFNTYVVYGLPPRPICNPGLASLVAAVFPLPGSEDLYFVAQGDGSHYFSPNAREHGQAKARYKTYLKELETERQDAAETHQ